MSMRNSPTSYGWIAKTLHWGMAAGFLIMFPLGFYMTGLPLGPDMFEKIALHKSIGAVILFLAVLRLAWRLFNPAPRLPDNMAWYERVGAHATHIGLYVLMFAMPLSGWAMSSAANFPLSVFGWFTLPALMEPNKEMVDTLKSVHAILGYVILAVLALHVLAALKHHFWNRDDVLQRMLAALVLMVLASPAAHATEWTVNEDSKLGFVATQTGAEFEGAFEKFDSRIVFAPDNLGESVVEIVIYIDSVNTQSAERDGQIVTKDWFDTANHPTATFKTDTIRADENGGYLAEATLTMRGTSKQVQLPFSVEIAGNRAHAKGELTVQRTDYGIGQGQWMAATVVGDDVRIFFDLQADKK